MSDGVAVIPSVVEPASSSVPPGQLPLYQSAVSPTPTVAVNVPACPTQIGSGESEMLGVAGTVPIVSVIVPDAGVEQGEIAPHV